MRIMLILVSLSLTLCITALIYLIIAGRRANLLRPEVHRKPDVSCLFHVRVDAFCVKMLHLESTIVSAVGIEWILV